MDYKDEALNIHRKLRGKIEVKLKDNLDSLEKLKMYYTPGVGAVSQFVYENPEQTRDYTWTNNSLAVISDGSAVLGLGNIGPNGALPVMEGKAMLFKQFANIDAVPIVLDVHSADDIVSAVKAIAPSFGAINLEDIAAPICFEVEDRLKNELTIPVMHDDQHGTAVVVLAGIINAMKLKQKSLSNCRVVVIGAGAAGTAIIKLLNLYANPEIIVIDSKGIICHDRDDLNKEKVELLNITNPNNISGALEHAISGADIFIGVSKPGVLSSEMVGTMNEKPVIFALSNPTPEIMPDEAKSAGAYIVATGRSDFPNQVNNALAFPGIFRGALDNRVESITDEHKIKTAETIANLTSNITPDNIIPSIFQAGLAEAIAKQIV